MSFSRGIGDSSRAQPNRAAPAAGAHDEEHRLGRAGRLALGTLACARCDAPIALAAGPASPTDALTCLFCANRGTVRDFLSLGEPTRPARVEVRIVRPAI